MVEEVLGARVDADEDAAKMLSDMAERRLCGEPLQYVLGSWQFRTLELEVDRRALIPRPETEQVVEIALAEARRRHGTPHRPFRIADLGAGCGAIALALAVELGGDHPQVQVVGSDADPSAIALAEANLRRVAVRPGVAAQVTFGTGNWFDPLPPQWRGTVGLVVSNPPYVSEEEWATLEPEVRCEPYGALVAATGKEGTPGFAGVESVLAGARDWLAPGAAVVVEMAPHHAGPARALAASIGYHGVRVEPDLAGRARALVARR